MTLREQATGILFFANDQTIAIFWNVKNIFLFDSHSRDQNGKPISNGTSVLMTFPDLLNLKKYINETYFSSTTVIFESDYIKVTVNENHKKRLLTSLRLAKRTKKYTESSGSTGHSVLLAKGRLTQDLNYSEFHL